MLFNSLAFAVFFPVVTLLFFILPHKLRWVLLLAASCFFYMFFKPIYILILAFTIVVDYFAGILIETADTQRKKYLYLVMSIAANVGVLAVFKYYNFINENLTSLFSIFGVTLSIPFLKILLPIGLSFHTFQAMSYTIEVYRGNQKAERHFGIYSLYVMFYPQLVAGPIERPQNLLHQFHAEHHLNYDDLHKGLRLILWGLFKKVVIADRLGIYVNGVYHAPDKYSSLSLIIASAVFGYQVYCDFSGYSDIALGSAQIMGFKLMRNFNHPFQSKSITEYWRRWHISLSTWFNDYLFTPIIIGKRDWGKWAVITGLLVTFFISGLWHGAAWTFIIWGVLHGIAMIYEFLTKKHRIKWSKKAPPLLYNAGSQLLVFSFLILTWVFFRADTVVQAGHIISRFFHFTPAYTTLQTVRNFGSLSIAMSFLMVAYLIFIDRLTTPELDWFNDKPKADLAFCTFALTMIICFGVFSEQIFIYFQF